MDGSAGSGSQSRGECQRTKSSRRAPGLAALKADMSDASTPSPRCEAGPSVVPADSKQALSQQSGRAATPLTFQKTYFLKVRKLNILVSVTGAIFQSMPHLAFMRFILRPGS